MLYALGPPHLKSRSRHSRRKALKALLIVNASASSVTPRSRVVIQKALSADHNLEVAETSRRGHASRLARGAANSGFDAVISLGGDGTLNETANGLVGTKTMLGVLPGGSTNVFARTIGLPNDPIEATATLLEAMAVPNYASMGVGTVNGRCFLFHVGIGFDAAVVEQVEKRGSLKRWAGHPLFIYSAIDTWLRHYDRAQPHFTVSIPSVTPLASNSSDDSATLSNAVTTATDRTETETIDDGYFAIGMNTDPYTYLGNRPLSLMPGATSEFGLSLVTLKTLRFLPLVRSIATSLVRGNGLKPGRWLDVHRGITSATISGTRPIPFQVDGDYLGAVPILNLGYEPEALNILMPLSN